jgi:hypothetical protein
MLLSGDRIQIRQIRRRLHLQNNHPVGHGGSWQHVEFVVSGTARYGQEGIESDRPDSCSDRRPIVTCSEVDRSRTRRVVLIDLKQLQDVIPGLQANDTTVLRDAGIGGDLFIGIPFGLAIDPGNDRVGISTSTAASVSISLRDGHDVAEMVDVVAAES